MTITGDTDPDNPLTKMADDRHHIGAVLTVMTGRPLATLGAVYRLLKFMTGEVPMAVGDVPGVDNLEQAQARVRPLLIEQCPDLAKVFVPRAEAPDAVCLAFLAEQENRFGAYVTLTPIADVVAAIAARDDGPPAVVPYDLTLAEPESPAEPEVVAADE